MAVIRSTMAGLILLISVDVAVGQKITSIHQINFGDFTFTRNNSPEQTSFVKGKYAGPNDHDTSLMNIAYGDLTNDGIDEAVVLLRSQDSRISPTLDEVFIYTLKDGMVTLLTNFDAGRRGDYVASVNPGMNFKVQGQQLVIDLAVRRNASEYVPTHYYTVKYRWNGKEMLEVERSPLKILPADMREIG